MERVMKEVYTAFYKITKKISYSEQVIVVLIAICNVLAIIIVTLSIL